MLQTHASCLTPRCDWFVRFDVFFFLFSGSVQMSSTWDFGNQCSMRPMTLPMSSFAPLIQRCGLPVELSLWLSERRGINSLARNGILGCGVARSNTHTHVHTPLRACKEHSLSLSLFFSSVPLCLSRTRTFSSAPPSHTHTLHVCVVHCLQTLVAGAKAGVHGLFDISHYFYHSGDTGYVLQDDWKQRYAAIEPTLK